MPKVNKPKSTDIQEQLAKKLQTLRQQKDVSQAEMAKYIGLTVGAYQNYENGRREANYETLCKLADFYNVSTDYLLGRTTVKKMADAEPDPFADIDVAELDKHIIETYTGLDEDTKILCIKMFLAINPSLTELFQEVSQQLPEPEPTGERHVERLGDIEDALKQEEEAKRKGAV